jgi:hypothetical protein
VECILSGFVTRCDFTGRGARVFSPVPSSASLDRLPLAALGWACGRHVVVLMYGAAFAQSGPYFEWLCLVIALSFVNYGLVAIMVPLGRSALQFQIVAMRLLSP